jgi:hypothetical protein
VIYYLLIFPLVATKQIIKQTTMKHKFTTTTFLVLAVLLAVGQNADFRTIGKYGKSAVDLHLIEMGIDSILIRQESIFQRNRNLSQNPKTKFVQTIKQKLDSMISENYDDISDQWIKELKQVFKYNNYNNAIQEIHSIWNSSDNTWTPQNKQENVYNLDGYLIEYSYYEWDKSVSTWTPIFKYDTNVDGNIFENTYYEWELLISSWNPKLKWKNIYDSDGDLIETTIYQWDLLLSSWALMEKNESTYDSNKKNIQNVSFRWSFDLWIPDKKIENTYDNNGNLIRMITRIWDSSVNSWEISTYYEAFYDSQGKIVEHITSKWDKNNSQLAIILRIKLTYDSRGNILRKYTYDRTDSSFNADGEAEFSFDENGNLIKEINRTVFGEDDDFRIPNYKIEYYYNNLFSFDQLVPAYYILPWNASSELYPESHMISYYTFYKGPGHGSSTDIEDNVWIYDKRVKFYYSEFKITAISEILTGLIRIYPNPATDFVVFELKDASQPATIEITDLQGKKVVSQVLPDNRHIAVSQLKSGLYFYTVSQNERIFRGKVLVK